MVKQRNFMDYVNSTIGRALKNHTNQISSSCRLLLEDIEKLVKSKDTELSPEALTLVSQLSRKSQVAIDASSHLDLLERDLIDYTNIKAGRFAKQAVKFDPFLKMRDVVLLHKTHATLKSVNLNLHFSKDTPKSVFGDQARLVQVTSCLVSNAVKFTQRDGTVDVICKVFNKSGAKYLRVKVQDTGPGVPLQSKLFEPSGRGIRLHLAQEISKQYGSEISFESRQIENEQTAFLTTPGSIFEITWPLET